MFEEHLELLRCGHFLDMSEHYTHQDDPMDYLIVWVLAGLGFVETNSQRVEARPGQLFTFLPHQPQTYGSDRRDPWEILWVHCRGPLATEFVRQIRYYGIPDADLGLDPEIRDRWTELVLTFGQREPGFQVRVNTGLAGLFGLILFRLLRHTVVPEREQPLDVPRLQSYIQEHLREPVTLADLARQAHLSPTHFARVFKQQFQVSPIYYLLQQRVSLAASLISETSMPFKEISQAVGYADPYYFSRLFKKMTGLSPTAYRHSKRPAPALPVAPRQ